MIREFYKLNKDDQIKIGKIIGITLIFIMISMALGYLPSLQHYFEMPIITKAYYSVNMIIVGLCMNRIGRVLNPYRNQSSYLNRFCKKFKMVCYVILGMAVVVWFL